MASKPGKIERVWAAADALEARGELVTVVSVRREAKTSIDAAMAGLRSWRQRVAIEATMDGVDPTAAATEAFRQALAALVVAGDVLAAVGAKPAAAAASVDESTQKAADYGMACLWMESQGSWELGACDRALGYWLDAGSPLVATDGS